jgi:hypothetical protein
MWVEPLEGYAKNLTFRVKLAPAESDGDSDEGDTVAEISMELPAIIDNLPPPHGATIGLQIRPSFILSPLVITAPSKLRISVLRDGERWAIGRLHIPGPLPAAVISAPPSPTPD